MARSTESFAILTLEKAKNGSKINKINENINKLRNVHGYFMSQKAYFMYHRVRVNYKPATCIIGLGSIRNINMYRMVRVN